MADDTNDTQPARRPRKQTMAPAARDPEGARGDAYGWLRDLENRDLDELTNAVTTERRRRVRVPQEPSFGMSEGERDELERTGRTVSPFTGEKRGDWPDEHDGVRSGDV